MHCVALNTKVVDGANPTTDAGFISANGYVVPNELHVVEFITQRLTAEHMGLPSGVRRGMANK